MKKIQLTALTLALCMAFSACSRFVPSSYTRVSAHSQTKSEQMDTNVVNVDDYAGLRRITSMTTMPKARPAMASMVP